MLPKWLSGSLPVQETPILSLGQEDPLEKERQPTPVFLPGEFYGQRIPAEYSPWGSQRVGHDWVSTYSFTLMEKGGIDN